MTDELIEQVAREIWDRGEFSTMNDCILIARAIIAVIRPAVLEEAAEVCEAELVIPSNLYSFDLYTAGYNDGCSKSAASVRKLKEKKDE